jgi:threonine/homoserine/homoserine lactone efflux protein
LKEFQMTIETTIAFALAMVILAATPGPGVFASVAQALATGFRSSWNVIAGIITGDILFLLLAVFGLSAVARALGELFFIVRLAGGAYLIWLGYRMWTAQPISFSPGSHPNRRNGRQRYLAGLFITLGNPKVILFYVGFLPTFIDLDYLKGIDIMIIAGLVMLILAGVMGFYCYMAGRARRLFASRRATRNLNRCAGTVMIGTGLAIAVRR